MPEGPHRTHRAAFRPGELTFRSATGTPGAMPDGPGRLAPRGTQGTFGGDRWRRSCRSQPRDHWQTSAASFRLIPAAPPSLGCSYLVGLGCQG